MKEALLHWGASYAGIYHFEIDHHAQCTAAQCIHHVCMWEIVCGLHLHLEWFRSLWRLHFDSVRNKCLWDSFMLCKHSFLHFLTLWMSKGFNTILWNLTFKNAVYGSGRGGSAVFLSGSRCWQGFINGYIIQMWENLSQIWIDKSQDCWWITNRWGIKDIKPNDAMRISLMSRSWGFMGGSCGEDNAAGEIFQCRDSSSQEYQSRLQ